MAKVLLVEDDNNLREIYEARLQAEGYETATASDGEQALVVAKEAKPDLVISDVMMPKISGFEMLDILRNTDGMQDVKVIMLTALGQAEDKTRADQLGADKYLVKSQVTLEDIVKTAHQLLDDGAPAAAVPAPASEPTAAPAATPVAAPTSAAPAATDAPSTAQETQAMQAQIDSFAAQPAVDPPASEPVQSPDPVVAEPAATAVATPVATEPAEPVEAAPAAETTDPEIHDDRVMAEAVDSLTGNDTEAQKPSDVTAVEVAPPDEPMTNASDDSVGTNHKKVIKPITDGTNAKPDINQLLAAEEASAAAAAQPPAPVPAPEPTPEPAPAPEPAPDPALQMSPELQAAVSAEETTASPAPATAPVAAPNVTEPPADPNQPDPNEIAL